MNNGNKKSRIVPLIVIGIIVLFIIFNVGIVSLVDKSFNRFHLVTSTANSYFDKELEKYAKANGINLYITHKDDLEIIEDLNDSNDYDAVWMSNSTWLYMLENSYAVTNTKSIATNPVVMGISKSKAEELGFVGKEIKNEDILNAVSSKKLKYVMTSVTKTNTGMTAYLNFLNALAGSPEVLSEEELDNATLKKQMVDLFSGVERVAGDEVYTNKMFLEGDYEAIISSESSLIQINKDLTSKGKEPLYLLYPVDGVAINDSPFGYVSRKQSEKVEEQFEKLQKFLRSENTAKTLQKYGYRTWYGGVNENVDKTTFNPEWGIDTTKYLMPIKYPSKKVIDKAISVYIEEFRKPTHAVFLLDTSGSMYGSGIDELKEAMKYILDEEKAKLDNIQFSPKDKITIITFASTPSMLPKESRGDNTIELINYVSNLNASGGTDIYSPVIKALKILEKESDEYTKTIILMTDGQSNVYKYYDVKNAYHGSQIPIYGITFGDADEDQLEELAELSNAKVFDGKTGLKRAFKEVRSYN